MSASCGRQFKYDVFLSFRGLDTRKNITSHLKTRLALQGINTFKDDETLQKGERFPEKLTEAIKTSKIAIVIISKNYATSKWCLEELRMIMKLESLQKIVVIPIFYDVNISDVRYHRKRFSLIHHHKDTTRIPIWEKALEDIANTQAIDSRKYQDEATIVEGVVELVSNSLLSMFEKSNDGLDKQLGKTAIKGCSLTDSSIRGNLQIHMKLLEGYAEHLSFVSDDHITHELELNKSPPCGFKSLDIMRFEWSEKGGDFKCGSFTGFPWLHELNLINLNIQKIPDDIDNLHVLEKLDLSGNMFKTLPTTMSGLTKLKHLTLCNCINLEELPELSQVESLTLSDCTNLRSMVKKQDQTTYNLLELWLDNCKKIESLPEELSHLTKLTYLDLSRNDFKTVPTNYLTSLITLSLNYCNNLESLSGLPLSLKCINAHGCKSLRTYSLQATHSIDHQDLSPCPDLKDYSKITRFPAGRLGKEVPLCACMLPSGNNNDNNVE